MLKKRIFTLILLVLPISAHSSSNYAISFEEFKKRLAGVFDAQQFNDIRKHLPGDFEIWGYDVGDFSDDGEPDVALSVKLPKDKKKELLVYFFVSDGPSFIEAKRISVRYYEIPIEVGFTIEKGVCFMTRKERNHHWFIVGYAFRNGSFVLVDRFEVGRRAIGSDGNEIGYEIYDNYVSLSSSESFFNVANGKTFLKALFYTFPSYRLGRRMLPDFAAGIRDTAAKYFLSGKEFWDGTRDLGFSARFAHDDSALYCFVDVTDDSLVVVSSTRGDGDQVELWFDLLGNRLNPSSGPAPHFRFQPDENILCVSVSPGDFKRNRPRVNLILRREPSEDQRRGINQIGVTSRRKVDGYALHIKIPFSVFDLVTPPSLLGFTLVVKDVDRTATPLVTKSLATSQLREWDPSSFGVLRFVGDREAYGEVRNFNVERLLSRMKDVGLE